MILHPQTLEKNKTHSRYTEKQKHSKPTQEAQLTIKWTVSQLKLLTGNHLSFLPPGGHPAHLRPAHPHLTLGPGGVLSCSQTQLEDANLQRSTDTSLNSYRWEGMSSGPDRGH